MHDTFMKKNHVKMNNSGKNHVKKNLKKKGGGGYTGRKKLL